MTLFAFVADPERVPRPADEARAAGAWTRIAEAIDRAGFADPLPYRNFASALKEDPRSERLVACLFANSPFLADCALGDLAAFRMLAEQGPAHLADEAVAEIEGLIRTPAERGPVERALRRARRRVALAAAAADVAQAWPLDRVTGTLSRFADAAIRCAAALALREAAAANAWSAGPPDDPERGSGLIVVAVGKLGAFELNFSSDVDLIVLYDPETQRDRPADRVQGDAIRLTRGIVRALETRTADGYAFRVDLRLRPDPGSTPIAVSVLAAEAYYESMGQNWERAALIKARAVAGDRAAGQQFLDHLRPFIWRRHLDFAAIRDIHSIKRQINAHRSGHGLAVAGHNLKLGRGGIREIEFFAQTQQLIWGGREPDLRVAGTEAALQALAALGKIAPATAEAMTRAYRTLRTIEHRLQMIADEQVHSVPDEPLRLRELAVFFGHADADAFARHLTATLQAVEAQYVELFADAPPLTAPSALAGNLVFTGGDSDPETLTTIGGLGYRQPDAVDRAIRAWHHGRYRATRSTRARELLTELVPALLAALAKTPNPDQAFALFDRFLARLPAGVQLFSMIHSRPEILETLAEIMGSAPRQAESLAKRPGLLENVLSAEFQRPPPELPALTRELDRLLQPAQASGSLEEALDACRRWAKDRQFQIAAQSVRRAIGHTAAAATLSAIAECTVAALMERVSADFARIHGRLPGAGLAVVALGKLGGREMTPTSDLDLIFIYEVPPGVEASDGKRPLSPSHYHARLCQRVIGALTAATSEGDLYQIDMRLRPSGNVGPIASSLDGFLRYQAESAWTWEHMALTRARAIAGPPEFGARVAAAIRGVLARPRDPDRVLLDIADMRARIAHERRGERDFDLKYRPGGLVDIEFVAQALQLLHAAADPDVVRPNTRAALEALVERGHLAPAAGHDLIAALDLWQALQFVLRLALEGSAAPEDDAAIPDALQGLLARVGGALDFASLKAIMHRAAAGAHDAFRRLIEEPAETARVRLGPSNAAAGGR